jgi:hypothetical protein
VKMLIGIHIFRYTYYSPKTPALVKIQSNEKTPINHIFQSS